MLTLLALLAAGCGLLFDVGVLFLAVVVLLLLWFRGPALPRLL